MAPFEHHLRLAVVAHLCLLAVSVVGVLTGLPARIVAVVVVVFPVTVTGGLFPDVDHHASRPYRLIREWFPRIGAVYVAILLWAQRSLVKAAAVGTPGNATYWAGIYSLLLVQGTYRSLVVGIPLIRPRHRGLTHRRLTGIVMGLVTTGLALTLLTTVGMTWIRLPAAIAGMAFIMGFWSHRLADGLVELPKSDWLGAEEESES